MTLFFASLFALLLLWWTVLSSTATFVLGGLVVLLFAVLPLFVWGAVGVVSVRGLDKEWLDAFERSTHKTPSPHPTRPDATP